MKNFTLLSELAFTEPKDGVNSKNKLFKKVYFDKLMEKTNFSNKRSSQSKKIGILHYS